MKISGQDRSVGKYASPPYTTTEKNHNQTSKIYNTQNHQKIKL